MVLMLVKMAEATVDKTTKGDDCTRTDNLQPRHVRHRKTTYIHLMLTAAILFHKAGTEVNLMKGEGTGKL